ncbi:tetratricopeptide repeat protein [Halopseudomonas pachastrellae]|nr:tetratricopeptide repeat protein [Halopseudomonas pachastrellae]
MAAHGDTRFLTDALQLAEEQQDWALMETLVAEAMQQRASANLMLVLLARGLLAERAGQFAEAERLYLQGLSRQPRNSLLRARILWLFVDAADRTKLARALRQWEGEAQSVPVLWLPMGAANQLLSRNTQALQWFNRHLREQPDDTLALAAYADALEASERRRPPCSCVSRLLNRLRFAETERAPFTERQIWSRLMTAGGSPSRRWRGCSVGMTARSACCSSGTPHSWRDWTASIRKRKRMPGWPGAAHAGCVKRAISVSRRRCAATTARRWPRCWLTRRSTTPTGCRAGASG